MNIYRPLLRPASVSTLPDGIKWEYVEAPPSIAPDRPDLTRSGHVYGMISTDRPLTVEERARFALRLV